MSAQQLDEFYAAAVDIAKQAGAVALDAFHREKRVQTKSSSADLVTETDKKVQDLVISFLKNKFPDHKFIGEESETCAGLTDAPTWIIDPVDGTTNFVHNFLFSAVSIGLTIKKEPVVGVVYNFILDQLYSAKKGHGATLNGKPIRVSGCTDIPQSLIVSCLGYSRGEEEMRKKMDTAYNLTVAPASAHGFRCIGSAALGMCMVACGSADAYFEYGIHCWDIAAADVIVREAGGVTMFPTGEPLDLMRRGVLAASTEQLARQMVPHINHIEFPRD
ncbi:hypothetical protein EMCRGX_G031844 [Ephydatia muelleri]|eukprot:Em0018g156a